MGRRRGGWMGGKEERKKPAGERMAGNGWGADGGALVGEADGGGPAGERMAGERMAEECGRGRERGEERGSRGNEREGGKRGGGRETKVWAREAWWKAEGKDREGRGKGCSQLYKVGTSVSISLYGR